MKTLARGIVVFFLAASLSALCWGDWKSDLTSLGFYAVCDGKAIPLKFVNQGDGETERGMKLDSFPSYPILKTGDFLILYGEMPAGPLGTTVEVFKYRLRNGILRYIGNAGDASDFFSMEPLETLRGQKLFKLNIGKAAPGAFCLHKFVGVDADAYAAFQIGEGAEADPGTSPSQESVAAKPVPKKPVVIATPENLINCLTSASSLISERKYVIPSPKISGQKEKSLRYIDRAIESLTAAYEISISLSPESSLSRLIQGWLESAKNARELFAAGESNIKSYDMQRKIAKEIKQYLEEK